MRYPKIGHELKYAVKYVCAKSHEGCQSKSTIIRLAKNKKKVILDVISIENKLTAISL